MIERVAVDVRGSTAAVAGEGHPNIAVNRGVGGDGNVRDVRGETGRGAGSPGCSAVRRVVKERVVPIVESLAVGVVPVRRQNVAGHVRADADGPGFRQRVIVHVIVVLGIVGDGPWRRVGQLAQSPGLAAVGSVMRPRRIWRTGGVKSAVKRAPGRRPDHILRIRGRHGDLSANGRGQLFGAARPELLGGY